MLDPGFLLARPVAHLSDRESRIQTALNNVLLIPKKGGDQLDLYTERNGQMKYRLTFKVTPVEESTFLRAWDASFAWEMMRYPVLTRVANSRHLYLQDDKLQIRSAHGLRRIEMDSAKLTEAISTTFSIAPALVNQALAILHQKGETLGRASTP